MAEIALPLVALAGIYISSKNNSKKEAFESNSKAEKFDNEKFEKEYQEYIKNKGEIDKSKTRNDIMKYPNYKIDENSSSSVDKYYKKAEQAFNESQQQVQNYINDNGIKSLTGESITAAGFSHNNMVPFFGSKVKQVVENNDTQRMDYTTGKGSLYMKKREQAPLFNMEENMNWVYGTPNQTDFIQSRINPSMNMSNVKPFQEVRVGPGLEQNGGVVGTGGFNAGMQSRDAWMPKNVDDLRVKNNPKMEYKGVVLGPNSTGRERGDIGRVEKNRPDTYWINTPERYFTTVGAEKRETVRSQQMMKDTTRNDTTSEYFGVGEVTDGKSTYISGEYMPSKRMELVGGDKHMSNMTISKLSGAVANVEGHNNSRTTNNRDITQNRQPQMGVVSGVVQAIVSPLLDVLRTTRKENVIGNVRETGNVGNSSAQQQHYVYNPNSKARTTIREMTERRADHMFVGNQGERSAYGHLETNPHQFIEQQRDTTNTSYSGNAGNNGMYKEMVYDSQYNANLIDKEPISRGRAPMGSNVKVFNQLDNTKIMVNKQEKDIINGRSYAPNKLGNRSVGATEYGNYRQRIQNNGNQYYEQRIQSDLLSALNNNPLSKPVGSFA